MSKRDLYESIINFRTTIDTTLEENKPAYDNNQMQPPPVEMPKFSQVSTINQQPATGLNSPKLMHKKN